MKPMVKTNARNLFHFISDLGRSGVNSSVDSLLSECARVETSNVHVSAYINGLSY